MIRTNESANPVRFLRKLKDSDHPIPSGLHAACRKGKAWGRVPSRLQPAGSAGDAGRGTGFQGKDDPAGRHPSQDGALPGPHSRGDRIRSQYGVRLAGASRGGRSPTQARPQKPRQAVPAGRKAEGAAGRNHPRESGEVRLPLRHVDLPHGRRLHMEGLRRAVQPLWRPPG